MTATVDTQPARWRVPFSRTGWAGVGIVAAVVALAGSAPLLTPYRPTAPSGAPLAPPNGEHPLGTNAAGQDIASQLLAGAGVSLLVAVIAGGGSLLIGAAVGVVAGWRGGRTDAALMRIVDLLLATPRLPLLIVMGAYVGPTLWTVATIIALTSWPPGARVVRSQVLSLRNRTHLRAAVGFGAGTWHALRRHIVPEVGLILIAGLVSAAGRAVMLEAGLSFLGLGDPTRTSWGGMIRDAIDFGGLLYTDAWSWWLLPPVLSITVLLLGFTFAGLGLEEAVNPALRRHRAVPR